MVWMCVYVMKTAVVKPTSGNVSDSADFMHICTSAHNYSSEYFVAESAVTKCAVSRPLAVSWQIKTECDQQIICLIWG